MDFDEILTICFPNSSNEPVKQAAPLMPVRIHESSIISCRILVGNKLAVSQWLYCQFSTLLHFETFEVFGVHLGAEYQTCPDNIY